MQSGFPDRPEFSPAYSPSGEIVVYDLLGRRLRAFSLPGPPWDKETILSHIKNQGALAMGTKIVRLKTEEEIHTWRVVP